MCSARGPNGANSSDRGSLCGEQWVSSFEDSSPKAFAHHFPCYDVLSRNLFSIVVERAKEAIFFRDIPPFVQS